MSIATWRKKFYPPITPVVVSTGLKAATHSLKKWTGVLKENLEAHGLTRDSNELTDKLGRTFYLNSDSCALCIKFYGEDYDNNYNEDETEYSDCGDCGDCPLYKVRGGYPCDFETPSEKVSPFVEKTGEKMVYWLEKTKEFCKENKL